MKPTIYNVKFFIGLLMVLCVFGVIKFVITFDKTLSEYQEVRIHEAAIEQQIWYEECFKENKQYKCDYMWRRMHLLD